MKDRTLRMRDGSLVATVCGACGRLKRDALCGPNRTFVKVKKFCRGTEACTDVGRTHVDEHEDIEMTIDAPGEIALPAENSP